MSSKSSRSLLLPLLFVFLAGVSLAVQTPYNVLGINTGDFGGEQFDRRNVFKTFTESDANDVLTAYGVNIPFLDFSGDNDTIFSAALDFESNLVPFRFAQVVFNPAAEFDGNYDYPHYSIRLWFYPSEFARGIECADANFPPCSLTPFLENRFSTQAPSQFYPDDYSWDNNSFEPAAGTFIEPNNVPSGQDNAVFRFGSYNGELIFYEILLPESFLQSSENGALEFDFPALSQYPITGQYFRQVRINTSGTKYKVSLLDLFQAPGFIPSADVFSGPDFRPSEGVFTNSVGEKNCVISRNQSYECGYKIIDTDGTQYCCRSRGNFDGFSCLRNTCSGRANLVSPPDAFFAGGDSLFCYARCATHFAALD